MKKQNNNITTVYHDINYILIRSKHPSTCIPTSGGNVAFWDCLHLTQLLLPYILLNWHQSTHNECFFYAISLINNQENLKKNKIPKANDNLYEKNYALLEQFIPLIGGGEFRWNFKHLSDQIKSYKISLSHLV